MIVLDTTASKKNRSVQARLVADIPAVKGRVEVDLIVEDHTDGPNMDCQVRVGDLKLMMGFMVDVKVKGQGIHKEFGLKTGDNSYVMFGPDGNTHKMRMDRKTVVTPSAVCIDFVGLSCDAFVPNEDQTKPEKEDWSQVAA